MFIISFCTIGMLRPKPKKSKEEMEKEKQDMLDDMKNMLKKKYGIRDSIKLTQDPCQKDDEEKK